MEQKKIIMRMNLEAASQTHNSDVSEMVCLTDTNKEQIQQLSLLMWRSFKDTPDDRGESQSEWEKEVSESFEGSYGEFLGAYSFISKDIESDQIFGAAMVSLFREVPLLIYLAVDPERQGKGLAVKMLDNVVEKMAVSGEYKELYLVVVPENLRAKEIYEKYGFLAVGSSWDEVLKES